MKPLRHSSLHSSVFSMSQKFQTYIVKSKGDIHIQKIKVKKYIFLYSFPYLLNQEVYFHIINIIRKASYSILNVLNFMDITIYLTMKLASHLWLTMPYHPCLSLKKVHYTNRHYIILFILISLLESGTNGAFALLMRALVFLSFLY